MNGLRIYAVNSSAHLSFQSGDFASLPPDCVVHRQHQDAP